MPITDEISVRLRDAFAPSVLEVIDDSERHRGHAGYQEGGESHFQVKIGADALNSMTRLERHRAIHKAIGADIIARIHALAIEVV
jgi:BolA protein